MSSLRLVSAHSMDRDSAISFFVWTARRVRRQFSGLELRITELLSPIGVSLETSSALHYRSPFQNQRFSILRRQASVTNAQSFTLYVNSKRGKMIHIIGFLASDCRYTTVKHYALPLLIR